MAWCPDGRTKDDVFRVVESNPADPQRIEADSGGARGASGGLTADCIALDPRQAGTNCGKLYCAWQPGRTAGWGVLLGAGRHGYLGPAGRQFSARNLLAAGKSAGLPVDCQQEGFPAA